MFPIIYLSALTGVTSPEFLAQCYHFVDTLPSDKQFSYLIDPSPDAERITVVIHDEEMNLQNIYKTLSCDLIDHCCHQENGDMMFVDDEGLLKDQHDVFWVTNGGICQFFAGKGLWLGTNPENGESTSPKTEYAQVCSMIAFEKPDGYLRSC